MPLRHRILTAGVATTFTLATLLAASPAAAQHTALEHGHIDAFHVTAPDSNSLVLDLKEDVTGDGVRHAPESVIITVGDHAFTDATESVRGVERPTYFLPQAQVSDLPWPGWDTNGVKGAGFTTIDLHVSAITGPGAVFLWQQDTFGHATPVAEDSALWLHEGTVIRQAEPSHVHANWGFDAPGTYSITVSATGINPAGAQVTSNAATYTFQVGSEETPAAAEQASAPAAQAAPGTPGAPGAAAPGSASAAPAAPGAPAAPAAPASGSTSTEGTPGSGAVTPTSDPRTSRLMPSSWWKLGGGLVLLLAGTGLFFYLRRQEES